MNEENIFLEILLIIVKKIKVVLLIPIIGSAVLVVYLLFFVQPAYTSNAKILSASNESNTDSGLLGVASQFGIQLPSSQKSREYLYPELIKSRTIAKSILKRKFTTTKHGADKTLLAIFTNNHSGKSVENNSSFQLAIEKVISMINVQIDGNIYNLSVSASEPVLARDIINVIIDELDKHQKSYNSMQIKKAKAFINDRLSSVYNELTLKEEELKNFRERNRRIENSPSLKMEEQSLQREVSVITSVYTTLKQQLEKTKIEEVKDEDLIIVLDKPEIPAYPSSPNKTRTTVIAFVLLFVFSLIVAMVMDYFENLNKNQKKKISDLKTALMKTFN